MENTKMPKSEVLTPDEALVADFIKTRTKKVLDDIQKLSKEQMQEAICLSGQKALPIWREHTAEIPMKHLNGSNIISGKG